MYGLRRRHSVDRVIAEILDLKTRWPIEFIKFDDDLFVLRRNDPWLEEFAERYPKAVKRATTLEWLPFSDPQLREASRCYLYGFFRATVLIAVAALEIRRVRGRSTALLANAQFRQQSEIRDSCPSRWTSWR